MIDYLKNKGDDKMRNEICFEYIHDDKNYITYEIVKNIKNKMESTIMSSSELEINIIQEYLKISELEEEKSTSLESNNNSFIEYKNLYNKIICLLRLNKNEKILSNLSLLYSIINNNDISVMINNEISSLLSMFNNKLKPTREIDLLEIKNILRRAKSYHLLNNIDKAQEDIVKCERLLAIQRVGSGNEYNQITNSIVKIKDDIKSSLLNEFIQKANQLLIEKKFADALELYNKAINMNKLFKSQLENCKFLINRSTCFISLLQYSIAVNELSKVLNILNRHRNIAIINKENQIVFDEIKNLEFLCYVRRGAAYSFEKNYEFAIKDYSNALEIRKDVKIEENLKIIKKLVGN
jgi:tetratricopeptide (TPR) repeat protein